MSAARGSEGTRGSRWAGPAVLALLLLAPAARADVIHLQGGTSIEGEIVEESAEGLTLQTRFGRQVIARSRIVRVEKKATPWEVLAEKEARVDAADAAGLYELACFARDSGLKKDHRRLLERVLSADPEHEAAHTDLGHVRHRGLWMTPEEKEAAVAEEQRAARRAEGLVEYQGRWVTPEERTSLEQGLVPVDGQWVTRDEAQAARGLVRHGEEWIPRTEALPRQRAEKFEGECASASLEISEHCVVLTELGEEFTRGLAGRCEKALALLPEWLGTEATEEYLGGSKILVVVLEDQEGFRRFVDFFAREEKKADARWAQSVARAEGFYWWDPDGTTATFRGVRNDAETEGRTLHQLGHVLLNRYRYNFKFLPPWIDEGMAGMVEREVTGSNATTCLSTRAAYGFSGERRDQELLPGEQWFRSMLKDIQQGRDPALRAITMRDFSTMQSEDVVKSMLVLHYLRSEQPGALARLVEGLREAWPAGVVDPATRVAVTAQDRAWQLFGRTPDELDEEVRRYYTSMTWE